MKRRLCLLVIYTTAGWGAAPCETEARALRETPAKPGVRRVLEACSARTGSDPARFALGVAAVEGAAYAEALRHLKLVKLPGLRDYVAYYQAQSHMGLGDGTNALKALTPIWKNDPPSPLLHEAVLLAAKAHTPGEAVEFLEEWRPKLRQPAGDLALALAYQATGTTEKAGALFSRIYFEYPLSKEAALAEPQWKALGSPGKTEKNILARAASILQSVPGRAKLDLKDVPGELAQVRMAAADYYARDYKAALSALQGMELKDPEADAERTYYLFQSARRANVDDARRGALDRMAKYYSRSPWYLEALISEAYGYLTDNDWQSYEPLYQTCVTNFPNSPRASFCHWKLTWSNYLRRRPQALAMLREHAERFEKSDKANSALYFIGRLTGEPAYYRAVIERHPNTYYSLIAQERLAEIPAGKMPADKPQTLLWLSKLPARETVALPAAQSRLTQQRIERARLLMAGGLDRMAEIELRFGARGEDVPLHIAMELAGALHKMGQVDRGVRTIKGMLPNYMSFPLASVGEQFYQLAFPIPYRVTLEKYARQAEIDPFVVAGLIRQESEFNAQVVSPSKAYGLTQILPSTGKDLSKRVGMRRFTASMLFDPTINIHLGTYYIRHLLNSLGGNWHEALAAYNGGRTRVIKWRTFADYQEPAEFIETIPFDETRGYVQSVLRNAAVYKQLYEGNAAAIPYNDEPVAQIKPASASVAKPRAVAPRAANPAARSSVKRRSAPVAKKPVSQRKNR